jgi:hypothetical protein
MVLVVFAILAVIGQVLNVFLCLALDNIFSPAVGALSFVLLYMLVFAGAWLIAVRIAERWEPKPEPVQAQRTPEQRVPDKRQPEKWPALQTSSR